MASKNKGEMSELFTASNLIKHPNLLGKKGIKSINMSSCVVESGVAGISNKEINVPKGIDYIVICSDNSKIYGTNKGFAGSDPTIFNASKIMNVVFDVILNDISKNPILDLFLIDKTKTYWKQARNLIEKCESPKFSAELLIRLNNLNNNYKNIYSDMLLSHYISNKKFCKDMGINNASLKTFLLDTILGKFHKNKEKIDFLSVDSNKNIYLFNLNDEQQLDELQEALLFSSYLDKPSRTRHDYGNFFCEDKKCKIKLCCQIRVSGKEFVKYMNEIKDEPVENDIIPSLLVIGNQELTEKLNSERNDENV